MLRRIRKSIKKKHPSEEAKYSSSNAAAHDREERVQLNKPKHYIIYKTGQEKNNKRKKKKNERIGRLTDLIQISRQKS